MPIESRRELVHLMLDRFDRQPNPDYREAIAHLLVASNMRGERLVAALLRVLQDNPAEGATLLAKYGDPIAIPHLARMLDELMADGTVGSIVWAYEMETVGEAIESLGGELTPEHRDAIRLAEEAADETCRKEELAEEERLATEPPPRPGREDAKAARGDAQVRSSPARAEPRPGRNAPCPCGSGRKFKKCCLGVTRA